MKLIKKIRKNEENILSKAEEKKKKGGGIPILAYAFVKSVVLTEKFTINLN